MTKIDAVKKLTETKTLSTDLLEPLGISFESFLRLCQRPKEIQEEVLNNLIEYYNADVATQKHIIQKAKG